MVTEISAYEEAVRKTSLGESEGRFTDLAVQPPPSIYMRYGKRVEEIILTLLLAPAAVVVIGACALLIKIFSPGPVFYLQERIGKDGERFYMVKLRTMIPDAEKATGPIWAQRDDIRITPVGRWLRIMRIDELPQLFHVLRGEMALVGPRPERPHFVAQLTWRLPSYQNRYNVRPGISGWAQVNHCYDSCLEDVREKLRYDLYYIQHMSWALDWEILWRTVGVIVQRKEARRE